MKLLKPIFPFIREKKFSSVLEMCRKCTGSSVFFCVCLIYGKWRASFKQTNDRLLFPVSLYFYIHKAYIKNKPKNTLINTLMLLLLI